MEANETTKKAVWGKKELDELGYVLQTYIKSHPNITTKKCKTELVKTPNAGNSLCQNDTGKNIVRENVVTPQTMQKEEKRLSSINKNAQTETSTVCKICNAPIIEQSMNDAYCSIQCIGVEKARHRKGIKERKLFRREQEFYYNYTRRTGHELVPIVKFFRLRVNGKYTKYSPDFFCLNTNKYIEVVGTRQAYNQNKNKYKAFKEAYPNIKFSIMKHTGDLYVDFADVVQQRKANKKQKRLKEQEVKMQQRKTEIYLRKRLIDITLKYKADNRLTYEELGKRCGLSCVALYNALHYSNNNHYNSRSLCAMLLKIQEAR